MQYRDEKASGGPELLKLNRVASENVADPEVVRFVLSVNPQIDAINKKIQWYNDATDPNSKLHLLKQIYAMQKEVNDQYPLRVMNACPDYLDEFHTKLYKELHDKAQRAGYGSIIELAADPTPSIIKSAHKTHATLPEILAGLTQEQFSKLLSTLSTLSQTKSDFKSMHLLSVFESIDDPLYRALSDFLENNAIEYLGGGNSINFKIIPSNPDWETKILKLEYRDDAPNSIKEQLTAPLFDGVVKPSAFERHGTWQPYPEALPEETNTRVLAITPYYAGGDALTCSERQRFRTNRMESALDLHTQMCGVLTKFNQQGYVFFDMKRSNWLINADGGIQLDDLKSVRFSADDGKYTYDNPKNAWCPSLSTSSYMNPPELMNNPEKKPFSVDKMQSYMLGINLYHHLTDCDYDSLENRGTGAPLDFSHAIFQSEEGKLLASFIERATQKEPGARPTLRDAQQTLDDAQAIFLVSRDKSLCEDILQDIAQYRKDHSDSALTQFIEQYSDAIAQAKHPSAFNSIAAVLTEKLDQLDDYLLMEKNSVSCTLKQLSSYAVGEHDAQMDQLVKSYQGQINSAENDKNPSLLKQLNQTLHTLISHLDADPCRRKIQIFVKNLREKPEASAQKKANDIERSIGLVPVTMRALIGSDIQYISEPNRPNILNVQLEMALPRGYFSTYKKTHLVKEVHGVSEINLKKATKTYRTFKYELADIRSAQNVKASEAEVTQVQPPVHRI